MSARLVFMVAALALCTLPPAGGKQKTKSWDANPKPIQGDYQVYGGTLAELAPPTKKDRKVAFMFSGSLAKDLFGQIGPDLKDACGAGPDHRARHRGDLSCVWTKTDGYSCYFGLDVITGKSTYGSIC